MAAYNVRTLGLAGSIIGFAAIAGLLLALWSASRG